jgi:spermidine synthase
MSNLSYREDTNDEFGVTHIWHNAKLLDSITTYRGTFIEMVKRPRWGIACYMNNSIQSCTVDERFYHESLVHPVMSIATQTKRVCIIGGGEGATAREVFKFSGVECVDMYEWDKDVVDLFKEKYPQWAQGAWNDNRLHLHHEDIFKRIQTPPQEKYDVIIIDLFDPSIENRQQWRTLFYYLENWINSSGSIVIYAGMRSVLPETQPYEYLIEILNDYETWRCIELPTFFSTKTILPYTVYIPSFSGQSMFLLITSNDINPDFSKAKSSHLTKEIWNSYKTLNW